MPSFFCRGWSSCPILQDTEPYTNTPVPSSSSPWLDQLPDLAGCRASPPGLPPSISYAWARCKRHCSQSIEHAPTRQDHGTSGSQRKQLVNNTGIVCKITKSGPCGWALMSNIETRQVQVHTHLVCHSWPWSLRCHTTQPCSPTQQLQSAFLAEHSVPCLYSFAGQQAAGQHSRLPLQTLAQLEEHV